MTIPSEGETICLHQSLIEHGVRYLQEACDIGAVHQAGGPLKLPLLEWGSSVTAPKTMTQEKALLLASVLSSLTF